MEQFFLFLDNNLILIYLLIFTVILGFEVISKVPYRVTYPLNVWRKCHKRGGDHRCYFTHS